MKKLRRYRRTGGGLLGLLDRHKKPLVCIGTVAFLLTAYSLACADDMQTRKLQTETNTLETHEKRTETHAECVSGELEGVKSELEEWESLGEFKVTAYCGGECCCGVWADEDCTTASGEKAVEGVTIAADTNILPFGTTVRIDGEEYTVQDTGGAIQGNRIDLYFDSHEDALQYGAKTKEVEVKR